MQTPDNDVPDDQKEQDHLVPDLDWWEQLKQRAAEEALKDTDDIPVPDYEPTDDDFDFEETPDEMSREETL